MGKRIHKNKGETLVSVILSFALLLLISSMLWKAISISLRTGEIAEYIWEQTDKAMMAYSSKPIEIEEIEITVSENGAAAWEPEKVQMGKTTVEIDENTPILYFFKSK